MGDRLFNMSVPPKSKVDIDIIPNGTLLIFDIRKLFYKLFDIYNIKKGNYEKLILEYICRNENWSNDIIKPKNYLLEYKLENGTNIENFEYEICQDINLSLYVYGKTIGNIYIPNREWNRNFDYERELIFLKSEVYGK